MKRHLLVLSLCSLTLTCAEAQTIIYRETFGNGTSGDKTLSAINTPWQGLASETGATSETTASANVIPYQAGSPQNLPNVGTGETSLSESFGFYYSGAGYANGLLYTTLPSSPGVGVLGSLDPSDFSDITFSWTQANSTNSGSSEQKYIRLALQIDGAWFVSLQKLSITNSSFDGIWSARTELSYTFTTDRLAWLQLSNATVGASPMTLGSAPASNLSGDITAFGIWNPGRTGGGPNGSLFIDTFTVTATAVPEPSAVLLILIASGIFFFKRHRLTVS